MNAPTLREQLKSKLDTLTDAQITSVWDYTEALLDESQANDRDMEHEPALALFAGTPELAHDTNDMLRSGISLLGGWTQNKT